MLAKQPHMKSMCLHVKTVFSIVKHDRLQKMSWKSLCRYWRFPHAAEKGQVIPESFSEIVPTPT